MDFIKAKGLTRVFYQGTDAEVHALKGVDISIDKGEMLSIIGRSGSGKSTLMHILGCVDRPDEGEYCFCGRSVNTLSERELAVTRNQKIGFVLQEFGLILSKTSLETSAYLFILIPISNTVTFTIWQCRLSSRWVLPEKLNA